MKTETVIILAVGAIAFMYLSRPPQLAVPASTTVGGQTTTTDSTFGAILGMVSSAFNAAGQIWGNTTPKTT